MDPAYAALAPLLLVLVAIGAVLAWRYREWVLEHLEIVTVAAVGLLGMLGLAGLLLRRPPTPPPEPDRTAERAAREKEAAAKTAADEAHAKAVAEKVEIDKMPEGPEKTKAVGDWWQRTRKRNRGGHFDPPGWLLTLIVFAAIGLMLAFSQGCIPTTAPPVYSLAVPPLPAEVLLVPAPPTLAEDACDASLVLIPGAPLPADLYEIGGVATVPRGLTITAACRAVPADQAELLYAAQADADRARLIGYLVAEREGRLADHVIAEARAAEDWLYIKALRLDNRIKSWTGVGIGLATFIAGVGLTLAGVQLGALVTP